ncbi:MAG: SIMPL domain-containing protein, partial [bacterium]
YRPDIIVAATQNAMTDAQILSKAANVGIVKVLKISLDDAQVFSPVRKDRFYAESMVAEGVPIEAGDVQINGSVTVVYEID